jgi:hypothetical protein
MFVYDHLLIILQLCIYVIFSILPLKFSYYDKNILIGH